MTSVELDLAQVADRPMALRFGATDPLYGELLCDSAPQPECPPGLTCAGGTQCLDPAGDPGLPVIERFEQRWSAAAFGGRRLVPTGHFVPEGQGPQLAADVRYLEHFAGTGCGADGAWPRLTTSPLVLGSVATLSVEGAQPTTAGVLLASLVPSASLPLAPGCELHLDLGTLLTLSGFATDGAGSWSTALPTPTDPGLVGTALRFQAFAASSSGAVGGFDVSNAAESVLE